MTNLEKIAVLQKAKLLIDTDNIGGLYGVIDRALIFYNYGNLNPMEVHNIFPWTNYFTNNGAGLNQRGRKNILSVMIAELQ